MTEYTVHFQKGSRVGARSLRMEHVEALNSSQALELAKLNFHDFRSQGYRIVRVDHFDDDGRIVVD